MKKLFLSLVIVGIVAVGASAQSKKVTELTADTAPTSDDLTMTVNDPAGTPGSRKVTLANLTKGLSVVVGDSGSGGTKGLVPAPGAGDAAANKFLNADGTYKTIGTQTFKIWFPAAGCVNTTAASFWDLPTS